VRAQIAVCGNVSIDVIDGGEPTVGGGPYHCAHGLRLVQRASHLYAKYAWRDRDLIAPALAVLGVPFTTVEAEQTAEFAITYDGDARHIDVLSVGDAWTPAEVEGVDAEWVHVAPVARSDFPIETVAALARGRRVSYDGQGLVRAAAPGPLRIDADYDPELLRHVAFLKLAEDEAAIVGEVRELGVPEVVVTLGSRGSIVYANEEGTHVPCEPIYDVDPTGCGDVFAVGYLAARRDGLAPVTAAWRATRLVEVVLATRKQRS
jgi:sugar/nucleoside kinase (ribokinase family)